MTFQQALEMFRAIYHRFEKIEGRPRGAEGAVLELVKQVGELARHVLVAEHYYFADRAHMPGYQTSKELIGDELADIFSMLIRIADHYEIDLEQAHLQARRAESDWLTTKGV